MKQMSLKEKFNSKFGIKKAEEVKPWIFDETSFDLHIAGGPTQTQTIKLEATLNSGEHKGKELMLNCKWFNKTDSDIKEIVGVTRQFYQPCLLDAGTTIHIQCMPDLPGKEYQGMPIIKEIGPLSIDKETEDQARQLMQSKQATFFINIMSAKLDNQQLKPSEGILHLHGNKLSFESKNAQDIRTQVKSIEINDTYPNYVFNRVNIKELKVELSKAQHIVIEVLNHMSRDVIGLTTKLMSAEKLVEKFGSEEDLAPTTTSLTNLATPVSPTKRMNSARDLLQIGDLTKQNRELMIEKQQIERKYFAEKDQKDRLADKLKQSEERLSSINNNYLVIEQELKKLREQKVKWEHHQTFLENEIKIARAECQHSAGEIQMKNSEISYYLEKIKKFETQQQKKSYEQLEKQYQQFLEQNKGLQSTLSYLASEKERIQQLNKTSASRIDQLNEQIVYLQKKHALLASQKMQQLKTTDNSHMLKAYEDRQKLRQKQFLKLQDQVKELIEENNLLRIHSPKAQKLDKKPKKSQLIQVQKVANRLAEAITEKDLINEQLRGVNKQMTEKIATLERTILQMEEVRHRPI